MNANIVKSKTGTLYEIQYVVHPRSVAHGCDVYACYRLSATDGMPIGPRVWIAATDLIDADRERISACVVPEIKVWRQS